MTERDRQPGARRKQGRQLSTREAGDRRRAAFGGRESRERGEADGENEDEDGGARHEAPADEKQRWSSVKAARAKRDEGVTGGTTQSSPAAMEEADGKARLSEDAVWR